MKFLKRIKKIAIVILGLFVLLLIAGYIFESISRNKAEKIIPTGGFADIDGHRLHYVKKGTGGPTIVFETAFDPAGHLQWYNIQQTFPSAVTTVTYDRAGILWSERGPNPKSGEKMAEELHRLLEKIQAPKPYILVGHSFGGTLARFFVQQYRADVAGLVLVDSQCPDDEKYLSDGLYKMVNKGLPGNFLKFANRFGLARLMFDNMFPPGEAYQYQNSIMPALLHKSAYGILEEQDQMATIKKEAAAIRSFDSLPLYVISAGDTSRYDGLIKDEKLKREMLNAWDTMQQDMLKLSSVSKYIPVPNSGHYINQEQPAVIENAIKEMLLYIQGKAGK